MTYVESVLDLVDSNDDDLLTIEQVCTILDEHSLRLSDWSASDECNLFGACSPDGLLSWLGY